MTNDLITKDKLEIAPLTGIALREFCSENRRTISKVREQVVNGLARGFEVHMIFKTQYRARGVAKTDIGFVVFETNKYGNGFDVLEILPIIEERIANAERVEVKFINNEE